MRVPRMQALPWQIAGSTLTRLLQCSIRFDSTVPDRPGNLARDYSPEVGIAPLNFRGAATGDLSASRLVSGAILRRAAACRGHKCNQPVAIRVQFRYYATWRLRNVDTNHIEKRIELKAPVSRVWRALTDYREFGEWFRVKLDGPFVPGQVSRGHITYPGYEHVKWEAVVQKMEPERLFSFTWHPYAIDAKTDYSKETPTVVEFRLEKTPNGTLLIVTESGFDKIPGDRRMEAFRMNDRGWTEQMKNIESHVAQRP